MAAVDRSNGVEVTFYCTDGPLPRGWSWGRHFSGVGMSGWYAIRDRDGYAVEIVSDPTSDVTPYQAIRAAIADGDIPRLASRQ